MDIGVATPTVVLVAEDFVPIPAANLVVEQWTAPTVRRPDITCFWAGWCNKMEKISEIQTYIHARMHAATPLTHKLPLHCMTDVGGHGKRVPQPFRYIHTYAPICLFLTYRSLGSLKAARTDHAYVQEFDSWQ